VQTYELEELLATKLRALYQRNAGRDLFDLAMALGDREWIRTASSTPSRLTVNTKIPCCLSITESD
jgi:predicted nucleotidyltransferase component of viral defense system